MNGRVILFDRTRLHIVHVTPIGFAVIHIASGDAVIELAKGNLVHRIIVVILYAEKGGQRLRLRSYMPKEGKP